MSFQKEIKTAPNLSNFPAYLIENNVKKEAPNKNILNRITLSFLAIPFSIFLKNPINKTTEVLIEGFRSCGYTEDVLAEGLKEFSQLTRDSTALRFNPISKKFEVVNLYQPGTKNYVYPGSDGLITPGDQIAGANSVCQMNINGAGVTLFWYDETKSAITTKHNRNSIILGGSNASRITRSFGDQRRYQKNPLKGIKY